jgi:hypothetical protein
LIPKLPVVRIWSFPGVGAIWGCYFESDTFGTAIPRIFLSSQPDPGRPDKVDLTAFNRYRDQIAKQHIQVEGFFFKVVGPEISIHTWKATAPDVAAQCPLFMA